MFPKKNIKIVFLFGVLLYDVQILAIPKYSRWNMLLLPTYSLALLVGVVGGEIGGAILAGSAIGIDRLCMTFVQRDLQTIYIPRPDILSPSRKARKDRLPNDVQRLINDYSKNIQEITAKQVFGSTNAKKTYKFSQHYTSFFYTIKNRGIISGEVNNGKFEPLVIIYKKSKVIDHRWSKRAVIFGSILAGVGIGCTKALKGT
ncbi:MAG TPA: hypothetical protein VHO47_04265 [Candidatus Babeliales bacterium]|nr:hypothetical protein [Candidatus Babeliales bacterium]